MSTQGTPPAPAGWYADPENPARGRFWDGNGWTQQFHNPGEPYSTTPELTAPEGTEWNTPWIWWIVALPVIPSLMVLFVPWGSIFDIDPTASSPSVAMRNVFAIFLSPFYWGALALSPVVYGLSALFAYRDYRVLMSRGVPRPFHWAFVFIAAYVYVIGRSVVVHRRTGRGHAPIWAEIGVFVLAIAISVVVTVMLFSGFAHLVNGLHGSRV
ncbi:MAG: DUF2510 domain-containing protein [Pseudolysinimonas sp.]|uniref:DUF2510 domain-containing protein n=1 Tax=Pseudolysinimonas sp. TaxID=2680009 RepID=UPI003265A900